jgi:hypothetical protein
MLIAVDLIHFSFIQADGSGSPMLGIGRWLSWSKAEEDMMGDSEGIF